MSIGRSPNNAYTRSTCGWAVNCSRRTGSETKVMLTAPSYNRGEGPRFQSMKERTLTVKHVLRGKVSPRRDSLFDTAVLLRMAMDMVVGTTSNGQRGSHKNLELYK